MSMSVHPDIIDELKEEGLLPSDVPTWYYMQNHSLIDDKHIEGYYNRPSWFCSVDQSALSGWHWLIASPGGFLQPLLCVPSKRIEKYICSASSAHPLESWHMLIIVPNFLFALACLVSLAVWCRYSTRKQASSDASSVEVDIQLGLLRTFSALGVVWSLVVSMMFSLAGFNQLRRSFSTLHAVLISIGMNAIFALALLGIVLSLLLNLATAVFLVEYSHSAQLVLLFASAFRARIVLLASLIFCLALGTLTFLHTGYIYCNRAGSPFLSLAFYPRLPESLYRNYFLFKSVVCLVLLGVTLVLLIVYVSKRCCACCRCASSDVATAADGVASYTRQLDENDDDGSNLDESSEPTVVIEVGETSGATGLRQLADELRLLILWHQIVVIPGFLLGILFIFLMKHLNLGASFAVLLSLLVQLALFSRLVYLSPILSGTYRREFVRLLVELKDRVMKLLR